MHIVETEISKNYLLQFSVNIAMEGVMAVILLFLFLSYLLQNKQSFTKKPLLHMMGVMILLLLSHICLWVMLINKVHINYGPNPLRVEYIIDWALNYAFYVLLYLYLESLIIDGNKFHSLSYKPNKTILKIMIIGGVLFITFYSFEVFDPYLYDIKGNEVFINLWGYIGMIVAIKLPLYFCIYLMIKNYKALNKSEIILTSGVLILTSALILLDDFLGFSISYMLLAFFVFLLYLEIDLARDLTIREQEASLNELQTQIILSQIQPHFIYNVLTTISGLCEIKGAYEARDVVNNFADYFRLNLDSLRNEKYISFEKELEHVKTYLWLEKVRYEDYLNIEYQIETKDFRIPSLLVQPIVENAIVHGIQKKAVPGTILIRTYETKSEYVVEVKDDGVGFDKDNIVEDNRSHVGLKNVGERIKILCGGYLNIQSEINKGTSVELHIPKERA